jgi:hypothetical protein
VVVNQGHHMGKVRVNIDFKAWPMVVPCLLQGSVQDGVHPMNIIFTAGGLQTKEIYQNEVISTTFGPPTVDDERIH